MTTESQGKEERHVARMQRKKEIVDQKVAAADQERGVLLVNTGNGRARPVFSRVIPSLIGANRHALATDLAPSLLDFIFKPRTSVPAGVGNAGGPISGTPV